MRLKGLTVLLAAVLAPAAEQPAERVFHLTHAQTAQHLQEAATLIRMVAGIRQVSLNPEQKAVIVRGTAEELRLAEWLVPVLDQPANTTGTQEYRVPGGGDDTLRVFHLTHAQDPRDLQGMATLVRSMADAQYLYIYTPPKALVLRGNAWRIGLAEWLIGELNRPADAPPPAGIREYRLQGADDDQNVVRVFYPRARTPEELTAVVTRLRSAVKMLPRAFVNTARGAVIVRADAGKIEAAEQALRQP